LDVDRIVVLRPGALGDVILTLPAMHALRARHPDAHLTVVGSPTLWELGGSLVDERVSIDAAHFSSLYADEPSGELRAWLDGVDRFIAWTVLDPSPALRAAGVPEILHLSPYPPPGVHVSEWLVRSFAPHPPLLRELESPPQPRLPSGGDGETGPRVSSPPLPGRERGPGGEGLILLHPGAGAVWKRWPAERFAAVGEALHTRGYRVALIQGPADSDAIERCQRAASSPFEVVRSRSPLQLAGDLGAAMLFIGNDSGVTHLAAAAGIPAVALFGPTDPATWAPLGRVRVLRHCDASASVPRQIQVCPGDCLERITVDEVLSTAEALMNVDNPVDNPAG
jgi:ADP-heptose:LPS heptosyltransferase